MGLFGTSIALLAAMTLPTAATAETIVLTNVRLIDGRGGPAQDDRTIVINNGKIAAVHADGAHQHAGAKVLDLSGFTVLPGLIDAHVHLANAKDREAQLRDLLYSGVTTVRELAGDTRITGDLARRASSGEIVSPAIYYSAVMFGPGFFEDERAQTSAEGTKPGTSAWSRVVTPDSDIASIVADARSTGATALKLYASLTPDLVTQLTEEAHRQGLLVWAHTMIFPAGVEHAVTAGADSVIHAKGMISLGRNDVPDTFKEGTQVWVRRFDYARTDPESEPFQSLYAEMVRRGTILEPALMADGERRPKPLPGWLAAMRDWACRATGAAHRAGVTIGAGTDGRGVAGELQRELQRLVDCGLTAVEAIRAATLANARAIGIEDTHGTIEAGKSADLIAVSGDPATDIGATRNVRMVIQGGRLIVAPD